MSATPVWELRSNILFRVLRLLLNGSLCGGKVFPIYKGFVDAL